MAIPTQQMSVTAFDEWVQHDSNAQKSYEYIAGEVIEVVSNSYSSIIAGEIMYHIKHFMRMNKIKGYVTGADGGYQVGNERYIPDVGYLSAKSQAKPPHETYISQAPNLAVEVVSPTDSQSNLTIKITNYLQAGTTIWVVYPDTKQVHIFVPNQDVQRLTEKDNITGGDIFSGFTLPVADIFPEEAS